MSLATPDPQTRTAAEGKQQRAALASELKMHAAEHKQVTDSAQARQVGRERERVCVRMNVCVCERERESVCV